jgi:hypothetical protein
MELVYVKKSNKMAVLTIIFFGCFSINHLKPSGNFTYDQVQHSTILRGAHIAFMCFVRISEQTATFAL